MEYLALAGGAAACFAADATADSDFAAPVSQRMIVQACGMLAGVAGKQATTPGTLKAKARVVLHILRTAADVGLFGIELAFVNSVIDDAAMFASGITDGEASAA